MFERPKQEYEGQLDNIRKSGLWKEERLITGPQETHIQVGGNSDVLNMCANNYLGLSDHTEVIKVAKASYDGWGYGLSSVRFICGTQEIHKDLEKTISGFLGTEDTILYSSCFDANGGLFGTILSENDAVLSDELNHASIIDGIRLCKAARYRYKNNDMADLEAKLREASGARMRLIATDGVFSMDGTLADLKGICSLAEKYDAMVMVDDSHAVGFVGSGGRGTPEYFGVQDKVDILTGTLGKALGGASGGYTSGRKEIIELLRQRSRPYLFSNSLAPSIVFTSLKVFEIISGSSEYRDRLFENTRYFREGIRNAGFQIKDGIHPIVPIMLGDAVNAQKMAKILFNKGVYVTGFFYPVVPMGKARIRVQISAAHSLQDLDFAIRAFTESREEMDL